MRRPWAFGRRSLPRTSTRTVVPGKSFATRVARVTPSTNSRMPSEPSYTSKGGIPTTDVPCWAICRWSLYGSAPADREAGNRNSAGSTSRRSAGMSLPYAACSTDSSGRTQKLSSQLMRTLRSLLRTARHMGKLTMPLDSRAAFATPNTSDKPNSRQGQRRSRCESGAVPQL
jgi:hypothetical protein